MQVHSCTALWRALEEDLEPQKLQRTGTLTAYSVLYACASNAQQQL